MLSPLKDIVIGTALGLVAGQFWLQFKNSELKRTSDYYKFYDLQQAKKATLAADDDDE